WLLVAATTGNITGTVTDRDTRAPMAGVAVVAQGPRGELAEITDPQGNFTIRGAPVGAYQLSFHVGGGVQARRSVSVEPDRTARVSVSLSRREVSKQE